MPVGELQGALHGEFLGGGAAEDVDDAAREVDWEGKAGWVGTDFVGVGVGGALG